MTSKSFSVCRSQWLVWITRESHSTYCHDCCVSSIEISRTPCIRSDIIRAIIYGSLVVIVGQHSWLYCILKKNHIRVFYHKFRRSRRSNCPSCTYCIDCRWSSCVWCDYSSLTVCSRSCCIFYDTNLVITVFISKYACISIYCLSSYCSRSSRCSKETFVYTVIICRSSYKKPLAWLTVKWNILFI